MNVDVWKVPCKYCKRHNEIKKNDVVKVFGKISQKEFKKQYLGMQNPMLQEAVEFLRTATFRQVVQARKDGLLTPELYKNAKRILEREDR